MIARVPADGGPPRDGEGRHYLYSVPVLVQFCGVMQVILEKEDVEDPQAGFEKAQAEAERAMKSLRDALTTETWTPLIRHLISLFFYYEDDIHIEPMKEGIEYRGEQ